MARERLYLFDTTLRDGAQTNGVDFTLADKLAIAGMLDELGIDYVEGGYPGANPTDTELFAQGPQAQGDLHRLRHDAAARAARPRTIPGLAALLDAKADAICFVAKSWDYHVKRRAARRRRRKTSPPSATACRPPRRRAAKCCSTASISSTATRPIPKYALACAKAAYDEGARWVVLCDTNGGTLPHEVEEIVGEVLQGHPRRPCRHPRPQRHRAGGGQFVCRRARRRAPDPGHAQRPGRALRQRQSGLAHPDAEAEEGIRRALRDRRLRRGAQEARACQPRARRAAQPRAQPPRALCRRKRLRHQGRHPRLRHRQGPGDLRACRAGDASATGARCWCRSRPANPTCWPSSSASA